VFAPVDFCRRAFYIYIFIMDEFGYDDRKCVSFSKGREPTSETILLRLHN
jgi:hypothetical protein